jgi:hypothetical protein
MQKILKGAMIAALALTIALPIISTPALAAVDFGTSYANNVGLANADPRAVAVKIIQLALGFLGILAVIIILIGGFKWMTAAGNEEQIEDAKKVLIAGVIGLVIILASWAIANFVISQFGIALNSAQ